jgi:hypothetical protein
MIVLESVLSKNTGAEFAFGQNVGNSVLNSQVFFDSLFREPWNSEGV